MNRSHLAKYLVLLGPTEAPRALLFNGDHRYLAEVFDEDGITVDQLMKSSTVCPTPRNLALDDVVPSPAVGPGEEAVRCYALG
ncbi:MAG: hypothetical protein ACM32J_02010 [Rhizobacter sp.]